MAATQVPISVFIQGLEQALKRHDGCIIGAKGENPKTGYLDLTITKVKPNWEKQFARQGYGVAMRRQALYWYENATRVWDASGLAFGIYEIYTGRSLGVNTCENCFKLCGETGTTLADLPREPGIAVFKMNKQIGQITHMGYMWKPVHKDNPQGDWYIIEARNVLSGVIATKLSQGPWNMWGRMNKMYMAQDAQPTKIMIVGSDCYVRTAPSVESEPLGVVHRQTTHPYGGDMVPGWYSIIYKGQIGWVTDRYGRAK